MQNDAFNLIFGPKMPNMRYLISKFGTSMI